MSNNDPSLTVGNFSPPESRSVEVDGFLGREESEFKLGWLLPSQLGNDAFTELYVETESGNTYAILKEDYIHPETDAQHNQFLILNGREISDHAEKAKQSLPVKRLTSEDMEEGLLKVGESFRFSGGNTSRVQKITCVNSNRYEHAEHLDQMTSGVSSSARSDFWALARLKPPHGQDWQK